MTASGHWFALPLMIQDILAGRDWEGVLTAEDERGLTPLFWAHVLPYGEVKLNMNTRLALTEQNTWVDLA